MSDFVAGFGRIFIFCTFLPGSVGLALIAALNPHLIDGKYEWYFLLLLVYGIGFVGNAVGHFAEVMTEWKGETSEYSNNFVRLCRKDTRGSERFVRFYEEAENIRVWYWNSAFTIVTILLVELITYFFRHGLVWQWWKCGVFVGALVVAAFLLIISCRSRRWLRQSVLRVVS